MAELQESYEQHVPPAADDGDPTHEQRLPRHPAATSAGVSTGSKQRRVSYVNIVYEKQSIFKRFEIFARPFALKRGDDPFE